MSNVILLIAFDYPPAQNPGAERTYHFAHYLKTLGWQPVVLTVNANTYGGNIGNFIDEAHVYRTFCLDVSKHLAYKGKYFGWLKQPDRYVGWLHTAVPKGLQLIKRFKPKVIWSTYPILTSHCVAYSLSKLTGIPWIADYRDPLQSYYDKKVYKKERLARWLDKLLVKQSSRIITVTEGAAELYRCIHHTQNPEKFLCIGNGYEPSNLAKVIEKVNKKNRPFELYHGGSLYETGRNPSALFYAIAHLRNEGDITKESFLLTLQGMNNQIIYQPLVDKLAINDFINFAPQVGASEAIANMMNANLLIVVQGKVFNNQIPSKVYEYLATSLPIIALTPRESETAKLLHGQSGCFCTENSKILSKHIIDLMKTSDEEHYRDTREYERINRTRELVSVLEQLVE